MKLSFASLAYFAVKSFFYRKGRKKQKRPICSRLQYMRCLLSFLLIVFLASGAHSPANEESPIFQIPLWIKQLGDDSFLVRQRAETLLIHAGIQAYPELQRAKLSRDLEIARRAEYVLSQIEQFFSTTDNRAVALWVKWYIEAPDQASKARFLRALASPTLDNNKGEGLHTLCRLVRFDENASLRLEAAKTLIAYPPVSPMLRQKWYQHIRDHFRETDADELFQSLGRFSRLWCDLDNADEKTTPELQNRVRQVSAETLRLLERPENNVQVGSTVDIMLHYAVAELQEAVGLTEEKDATIAAALAIVPEPIQSVTPPQSIGNVDNNLFMYEHYDSGVCLLLRFRLHWAMAHFQKVMETGDIQLRILASEKAAEIAQFLADYLAAAAYYDNHIEFLNSPEFRRGHNPDSLIALARKQKAYCLAEQAAVEENWEGVREYVIQAWSIPNVPIDVRDIRLVILAYQFSEQRSDVVQEFKDKMESVLKQIWKHISDNSRDPPDSPMENLPSSSNNAAWLLVNTGGDYSSALLLAETAVRIEPDNPVFLDTLAHVYFYGGKIDEAIRAQEQAVHLAPEAVIFRRSLERFQRAKK